MTQAFLSSFLFSIVLYHWKISFCTGRILKHGPLFIFLFCSHGRLFKRALNQDRAVKRVNTVSTAKLDYIDVVSIILKQAIPNIFYFKHDVETSWIIIFPGNSDVDNIGDAMLVLFYGSAAIRLSQRGLLTYYKIMQASCGLNFCIKTLGLAIKIISKDVPIRGFRSRISLERLGQEGF